MATRGPIALHYSPVPAPGISPLPRAVVRGERTIVVQQPEHVGRRASGMAIAETGHRAGRHRQDAIGKHVSASFRIEVCVRPAIDDPELRWQRGAPLTVAGIDAGLGSAARSRSAGWRGGCGRRRGPRRHGCCRRGCTRRVRSTLAVAPTALLARARGALDAAAAAEPARNSSQVISRSPLRSNAMHPHASTSRPSSHPSSVMSNRWKFARSVASDWPTVCACAAVGTITVVQMQMRTMVRSKRSRCSTAAAGVVVIGGCW